MFCSYTRPRYQVSIYKTTGPLVLIFSQNIESSISMSTRNLCNEAVLTHNLCFENKKKI